MSFFKCVVRNYWSGLTTDLIQVIKIHNTDTRDDFQSRYPLNLDDAEAKVISQLSSLSVNP